MNAEQTELCLALIEAEISKLSGWLYPVHLPVPFQLPMADRADRLEVPYEVACLVDVQLEKLWDARAAAMEATTEAENCPS